MSMINQDGQLTIRENPPEKVTIKDELATVLTVREVGVQGPPGDPGIVVSPTPPPNPPLNKLWVNST